MTSQKRSSREVISLDNSTTQSEIQNSGRRNFFNKLGKAGVSVTAMSLFGNLPIFAAEDEKSKMMIDTANQIFTAAVIAEDLATVFYYNGLTGPVITDPSLAGPGGTATAVSPGGNMPNVDYLRAALNQEIEHANLLRTVANLGSSYTTDPYQTFYFAPNTFSDLKTFIATLEALENAFIGAYLNAIRELAYLATVSRREEDGPYGGPYSASQLEYFAEVAASIMGVECEHRALGSVIVNADQPNNLYFESTDGLTSVYNGKSSAVVALTPFLTPATGSAYMLSEAVIGAKTVGLPSTGAPPAYIKAPEHNDY